MHQVVLGREIGVAAPEELLDVDPEQVFPAESLRQGSGRECVAELRFRHPVMGPVRLITHGATPTVVTGSTLPTVQTSAKSHSAMNNLWKTQAQSRSGEEIVEKLQSSRSTSPVSTLYQAATTDS